MDDSRCYSESQSWYGHRYVWGIDTRENIDVQALVNEYRSMHSFLRGSGPSIMRHENARTSQNSGMEAECSKVDNVTIKSQ